MSKITWVIGILSLVVLMTVTTLLGVAPSGSPDSLDFSDLTAAQGIPWKVWWVPFGYGVAGSVAIVVTVYVVYRVVRYFL